MAEKIEVITPGAERFGFCRGVVAADDFLSQVSDVASEHGIDTVYGYHDIVHNATVREAHERNGVVFVDDVFAIPLGSIAVLSAHGSSPLVGYEIEQRDGLALDAACPLVIHTHNAIKRARENGEKVIYLLHGKPGETDKLHDEVRGTVGHMDWFIPESSGQPVEEKIIRAYVELHDDPGDVGHILDENGRYTIVSQTTLDDLAVLRFRDELMENIRVAQPTAQISRADAKDVCKAVRERQEGVRVLLQQKPDVLVVVTDKNSKNGMGYFNLANRIVESEELTTKVHWVERADDLTFPIEGSKIAVTASASTPDEITAEVVSALGVDSEGTTKLVPSKGTRPTFKLQNPKPEDLHKIIGEWARNRV